METVNKKDKLLAYRNSLIDYERCVNKTSFRDLSVIFHLSESTVHDIAQAALEAKRRLKVSTKKPLCGNPRMAFAKLFGKIKSEK